LKHTVNDLQKKLNDYRDRVQRLSENLDRVSADNGRLTAVAKDYGRLRKAVGEDKADEMICKVKEQEETAKHSIRHRHEVER
jgi:hypothetical protein